MLLFSLVLNSTFLLKEGYPSINASPDLLPTFGEEDIYISEAKCYVSNPLKAFKTGKDGPSKKKDLKAKELEVFHMKCIIINN